MQEVQETWVQSLGQEDPPPLEEEMPTAPVFLPGKFHKPGGLHSTGSQSIGHDWTHRHARKMELMVITPGSQNYSRWGQCKVESLRQNPGVPRAWAWIKSSCCLLPGDSHSGPMLLLLGGPMRTAQLWGFGDKLKFAKNVCLKAD